WEDVDRSQRGDHALGESPVALDTDHLEGSAQIRFARGTMPTPPAGNDGFDDDGGSGLARRRFSGDPAADLVTGAHSGRGALADVRMEVAATDAARMDVDHDLVRRRDGARDLTELDLVLVRHERGTHDGRSCPRDGSEST